MNVGEKIKPDFCTTDEHRQWALRKGWPEFLPDTFVSEFSGHHEAKGTKMADWDRAFQNWMTWSSPAGRFYHASDWERHIGQAAQLARAAGPGPLVAKVMEDAPLKPMRSAGPSDAFREFRQRAKLARDMREAIRRHG